LYEVHRNELVRGLFDACASSWQIKLAMDIEKFRLRAWFTAIENDHENVTGVDEENVTGVVEEKAFQVIDPWKHR